MSSSLIQFPTAPFLDATGRISRVWTQWLLNPQFITINITGGVDVASGGTGIGSYAVGDMLVATATQTLARLADVPVGSALLSGGTGTLPAYGKVNLATTVTGIAPAANGGTGVAYFTVAGPTAARTYTFPDANATIVTVGGALGLPSSGNLFNCTGIVPGGISSTGTFTGTVTTAPFTITGSKGSMTFTNGLLTSQVQAT